VNEPPTGVDRTLTALADTHRRRAVELLGEGPMRAGDLAEAVGLAAPAMSRHLRVLRVSGLVQEMHPEEDARVRLYSLRPAPFLELDAWLAEMQVAWGDQLAAFKAHVERV
jgi:DNA-binding transcriptional ArsR family regulator